MNEEEGLDVGISIHAEGTEVAKQVADGIAALRKQLAALGADARASAEEQKAAARQAADELKASAINIANLRKAAREAERADARQSADELRASALNISNLRKDARAAELAADRAAAAERRGLSKQAQDELKASSINISNLKKADREAELALDRAAAAERRALNKQAQDELRASTINLSNLRKADRQAEQALDRAAAAERRAVNKQASDERRASSINLSNLRKADRDADREAARQVSAERRKARDEERAIAKEQAQLRRDQTAANRAAATAAREQAAAHRAGVKAVQDQRAAWLSLGKAIVAAAAAFAGFQAFRTLISEGLKFNQIIETANLGIASLITSQTEMTASDGRLIVGAEKLQVARVLATEQVQKLRVASLQTTATTEQLVVAFQQATGIGLRFGLTLDQIRVLTVQLSQAAGALGVPLNQMSEEIRSLLTGTITPRNTRIATALGITNAQIREAQKAGNLFTFVTKRLEAFSVAGEETAKTFVGVMSNIKEALQNFTGDLTKPLFDSIRISGQSALEEIFDLKNARIATKFAGILEVGQTVFAGLGDMLSGALDAGIEGSKTFSVWLQNNAVEVDLILRTTHLLVEEFGLLVAEVASLIPGLVDAGTKMGVFSTIVAGAGLVVALIHTTVQALILAFGTLGALILELIVGPVIGWLRIVSRIAAIFNKDIADAIDNAANKADEFLGGIKGGVIGFAKNLGSGGAALDVFISKIDGLAQKSEKAVAASHKLSDALARITAAEESNKKELDDALKGKLITQEEYAKKSHDIELSVVKQKLAAQKVYLASIAFEDEADRRRTITVISELKKQRDALEKNVKLKSIAGPPDNNAGELELGRGGESALTIAAKKELSIRLRDLKIALDQQKISYLVYFADVTEAHQIALDKQIKAQQILLDSTVKPGARLKILAQIKAFEDEKKQVIEDNDNKYREARLKLDQEVTKANITLLKDTGHFSAARAAEVNAEFNLLVRKLTAEGDKAGVEIVTRLFNIDNAKAQLNEFSRTSKIITDTLGAELQSINIQSTDHALNEAEARQQIVGAYSRARDQLVAMLPVMQAAAAITEDEGQIQAVENLRLKIEEMGVTIRRTADDWTKLKDGMREATQSGLANFINDVAEGAKSLGESFKDAARDIIGALRQIASQMLANLIIQESLKLFGFSGGGAVHSSAGGSTFSGGNSTGGVLAASGGYIRGPGTARSDSIPAWLSNGEYVIQASAVDAVGVGLLDSINQTPRGRKRSNRYADGGLVAPTGAQAGGSHTLSVGLEEGLVLRHMESSEGQRSQLKFIENNSQKIKRLI